MQHRQVAFLYTTFPVPTETFLRRELAALAEAGLEPQLCSMWQGDTEWRGRPILRMERSDWKALLWRVPTFIARNPKLSFSMIGRMLTRLPASLENVLENLAGFAAAITWEPRFRAAPPDHFHAAWSSGPASTAWLLAQLLDRTWSTGAHAYDVFRGGGDWLLKEKASRAAFIQCSTRLARNRMLELGAEPGKVIVIRRGLDRFRPLQPLRANRSPLRLVKVARFVPKKGHHLLIRILEHARQSGLQFDVQLIGDGPLRKEIETTLRKVGLDDCVTCTGMLDETETASRLAGADVLLHTGIVANNGDRDGLPNAVCEAMAAGVVVLSSPNAGVTEAIVPGWNGLLADPECAEAWTPLLRRLQEDDALCNRLRLAARAWTEAHYDAHRGAEMLVALIEGTILEDEARRGTLHAGASGSEEAPSRRKRKRKRKPRAAKPGPADILASPEVSEPAQEVPATASSAPSEAERP